MANSDSYASAFDDERESSSHNESKDSQKKPQKRTWLEVPTGGTCGRVLNVYRFGEERYHSAAHSFPDYG